MKELQPILLGLFLLLYGLAFQKFSRTGTEVIFLYPEILLIHSTCKSHRECVTVLLCGPPRKARSCQFLSPAGFFFCISEILKRLNICLVPHIL